MRLELSRRAQADLDDIRDYSVEHFGLARAILYFDAIEEAFRRVLAYPEIGATQTDLATGLRSLPVGEHRLFYRVERERILIVRLLHKAMNPVRHI
ncbi:type II toxin-antitoxin system RelE/ParE family toxin [Sphingobium sp. AN558]|uniref:type II toxin-antitoxin system RelE/ParE family toxin n=1 Tax=Sphingobium sp. AN558 TaxID=3133442 RepID=UPI0030BDBA32